LVWFSQGVAMERLFSLLWLFLVPMGVFFVLAGVAFVTGRCFVVGRKAIAGLSGAACVGAWLVFTWFVVRPTGLWWLLALSLSYAAFLGGVHWIRWRGRLLAYNAEEGRLNACVRSVLYEAGVQYREEPGGFYLPSQEGHVTVGVGSRLGHASIRFVPPRPRRLVAALTHRLGMALKGRAGPERRWLGGAYVGGGMLLIAEGLLLALLWPPLLLP